MIKTKITRNSNRRPLQKITIDKNTQQNLILNINKNNKLTFGKFDK
jgi:hypothetical protein